MHRQQRFTISNNMEHVYIPLIVGNITVVESSQSIVYTVFSLVLLWVFFSFLFLCLFCFCLFLFVFVEYTFIDWTTSETSRRSILIAKIACVRLVVRVVVFNATFTNISAISLWSVLLVEETEKTLQPAASHWQTLSHNVVSSTLCHKRDSNSQF